MLRRAALVLALAAPTAATAQVVVNHTGYLLGPSDTPVNGAVTLGFELFDAAGGGASVWSASGCTITVAGGYYATALGSTCGAAIPASALPADAARWLEVTVGTTILTPRQALRPAPSADTARVALDLACVGCVAPAETTGLAVLSPASAQAGSLAVTGNVSAGGQFTGSGSGLTSVPAAALTGTVPSAALAGTYGSAVNLSNPGNTLAGALSGSFQGSVIIASSSGDPFACNAGAKGALYFDLVTSKLKVCDGGGAWAPVGTGAAGYPQLTWSPASLAFGTVTSSAVQITTTLSNGGTAGVTALALEASSGFTISSTTCGTTLGAGASCTATVEFPPTGTVGPRAGSLRVYSSTGGPLATLAGTLAAPAGASSASPAASCQAIKSAYPGLGSALYWLGTPGNAYRTYCDMDTFGATGWTLVMNLQTSDATTRDYQDTAFWLGSTPIGDPTTALVTDFKSGAFSQFTTATKLMVVAHNDGTIKGAASYDLLSAYQNKSLYFLLNNFTNTTITTARIGSLGSVGAAGAGRNGGDAFIDSTHAVIVNSTYSPVDSTNYTRLGTNYADQCGSITCNGHNFGGWGGQHLRSGWGALYEGAALNGYCPTQGAFGTNGRALPGNSNAFAGGSSCGGGDMAQPVDLMVFVQ